MKEIFFFEVFWPFSFSFFDFGHFYFCPFSEFRNENGQKTSKKKFLCSIGYFVSNYPGYQGIFCTGFFQIIFM